MRIVKEAEERREEILDAAEKLFTAKGFDNTSTGDILDAVGIARGTLYYHFKSKEDILDGAIQRITGRLMQAAGSFHVCAAACGSFVRSRCQGSWIAVLWGRAFRACR